LDGGACLQAISNDESPASRLLRKTVIRLPGKAYGNQQVKNAETVPDPLPDKLQFTISHRPKIGFWPWPKETMRKLLRNVVPMLFLSWQSDRLSLISHR